MARSCQFESSPGLPLLKLRIYRITKARNRRRHALAFGVIGIYGIISYAVSQRTREMGIRIALGAQKRELRWLFVRSAMALTGAGLVIGFSGAAAVVQLLKALLFGISPLDPLIFA